MDRIKKLIYKIRYYLKEVTKIPYSIYLCLKFPFLYPRNRFTGLHYTNLRLSNKIKSLYQKTDFSFDILVLKDTEHYISKLQSTLYDFKNCSVEYVESKNINFDGNTINITNGHSILNININNNTKRIIFFDSLIESGTVLNYNFVSRIEKYKDFRGKETIKIKYYLVIQGSSIVPHEYASLQEEYNQTHICIRVNKYIQFKIKILEFLEKYILQYIFCIPTFTELDAMPIGWRKVFGLQMCKEIKKELKKHNYLYKYRIMQIKEKFGSLRLYDNGSPKGCIYPIIDKYEELSKKICIDCGKPAQYITKSYICPYCKKCIPKNQTYYEI